MSEPYPQVSDEQLRELLAALSEPFDPSQIKSRQGQGGKQFRYVDGKTALDRLNAVAEQQGLAISTGISFPPAVHKGVAADRNGYIADEIWVVGWLEIHGAGRKTDVGTALHVNEDSVKGATTDLWKRCLRQYRVAEELYEDAPAQGYAGGQQSQQNYGGGGQPQQQGGGSYGGNQQPQGNYGGQPQGQQQQKPGSRSDAQGNWLLSEGQLKFVNDIMGRTNWDATTVITNVLGGNVGAQVKGDFGVLRYRDGKAVLDAMIANEKDNPSWGMGAGGYGGNGDYDPYGGGPPEDDHNFSQAPAPAPAQQPVSGAAVPNLGARVLDWQNVVREAGHDQAKWKPLVAQAGRATTEHAQNEWMFEVLLQFSDRLILEGIDGYLQKQNLMSPRLSAAVIERRQQIIEADAAAQKG